MIDKPDKFYALRKRAEELLASSHPASTLHSVDELSNLLHELDTHRIELELQNDELLKTQRQLQDTTQDYIDFYNYSPVGYLTLNIAGIILKANMALTAMLGLETQSIIYQPGQAHIKGAKNQRY
jgi:PAS domain-containing protein